MSTDHTHTRNTPDDHKNRSWLGGRLLWLCPIIGLIAGAAILWLFGLTLWSAVVFLLLAACPLSVAWALVSERRQSPIRRRRP